MESDLGENTPVGWHNAGAGKERTLACKSQVRLKERNTHNARRVTESGE